MNLTDRINHRFYKYRIGCDYWKEIDEVFPGEGYFLGAMPIILPTKNGKMETGYTSLLFNPKEYDLLKARVWGKPVYKKKGE